MIHNISILTDDDIIQFADDVNINPVYLSRAIIIWVNCLNWLENIIVLDHVLSISCQLIWELTNDHRVYAVTIDFQQCGMCDQQSLRSVYAYAQSDQSPC